MKKSLFTITMTILFLLLEGCGDTSFSGQSKKEDAVVPEEIKTADVEKEQNAESKKESVEEPTAFDSNSKECALAVSGNIDQVIKATNGEPIPNLTPDSVVLIEVAGQVEFNLNSDDISEIKGLCIRATGGATLTLSANLNIGTVYHYGRGNATTVIGFEENGNLKKLVTDIGGGHELKIDGTSVQCDSIDYDQGGGATVSCNDKQL